MVKKKLLLAPKPTRLKNLVLGIGIFIVYILMLVYGIQAFKPAPKYDDFCKSYELGSRYPTKPYDSSYGQNCTFNKALKEQVDACYASEGNPIYEYDDNGCAVALKECNLCNKHFNEAHIVYDKFVFVVAIIAGIITLLIGYGILSVEPVGSALIASGLGAMVYGASRNWENLSNIWRFLLLLAALILLIWITLRINAYRKKEA